MIAFYVIFVVLVLVLYLLTQVRDKTVTERFIDMGPGMPNIDMSAVSDAAKAITEAQTVSLEGMPTPPELFKKARELMAKYDQPDLWIHAARVMDKDPSQLARMNLGLE
jgi:hypothetical protein